MVAPTQGERLHVPQVAPVSAIGWGAVPGSGIAASLAEQEAPARELMAG